MVCAGILIVDIFGTFEFTQYLRLFIIAKIFQCLDKI
jgi:hypothetical protein